VIKENLKIVDWSIDQWHNFYHAFFHRSIPKTTIIVIHKDGRPIKIMDLQGRSRTDLRGLITEDQSIDDIIKTIYSDADVDVVYAVSYPVIRSIFEKFARTVDFEDDYFRQLFTLKDTIAMEMGHGILRYPAGLQWLMKLEYNTIKKIFSATPDNALVTLTIFSEEDIWTNWIIGIEGGSINLITTLDTIKPGFIYITNWKREYHHITTAIRKQFGIKPISFFMDLNTFEDLVKSKRKKHFVLDALSTKKIVSKALPVRYRLLLLFKRISR